MEIRSSDVDNFSLLRGEIKSICNFRCNVNREFIKSKNWVCAHLDNKQLLDGDAENLVVALKMLGVDYIFGAWAYELEEGGDITVDRIAVNVQSIEEMQKPESRIDHIDSILFGEFPLRFLLIRPATYQDLLYLVGPVYFVKRAANSFGWKFVNP